LTAGFCYMQHHLSISVIVIIAAEKILKNYFLLHNNKKNAMLCTIQCIINIISQQTLKTK
jgi:hypothetical protein